MVAQRKSVILYHTLFFASKMLVVPLDGRYSVKNRIYKFFEQIVPNLIFAEFYAIIVLSKNKGIVLAEKNYLPLDKRGNVNVLVVRRFWCW